MPAALALVGFLAATSSCDGYAELRILEREVAPAEAEWLQLAPQAYGMLQLRVDVPATGPRMVIGSPFIREALPAVSNWAVGPCPGQPSPDEDDEGFRLCIALVYTTGGLVERFTVDTILEAPATGRRYTATAVVEVDPVEGRLAPTEAP